MEPNLGDVKTAYELGKAGSKQYLWVMCPMCNEKRWALKKVGNVDGSNRLCKQCGILKAKYSFKISGS